MLTLHPFSRVRRKLLAAQLDYLERKMARQFPREESGPSGGVARDSAASLPTPKITGACLSTGVQSSSLPRGRSNSGAPLGK